ncbi:hypothetical protein D3C87_1976300 [compost metagenome]
MRGGMSVERLYHPKAAAIIRGRGVAELVVFRDAPDKPKRFQGGVIERPSTDQIVGTEGDVEKHG